MDGSWNSFDGDSATRASSCLGVVLSLIFEKVIMNASVGVFSRILLRMELPSLIEICRKDPPDAV